MSPPGPQPLLASPAKAMSVVPYADEATDFQCCVPGNAFPLSVQLRPESVEVKIPPISDTAMTLLPSADDATDAQSPSGQ